MRLSIATTIIAIAASLSSVAYAVPPPQTTTTCTSTGTHTLASKHTTKAAPTPVATCKPDPDAWMKTGGPWLLVAYGANNQPLPDVAVGNFVLSYLPDGKLYAGNVKTLLPAEPFIIKGGNDQGFQFTSWHAELGGYQRPYIFTEGFHPVGLTNPSTNMVPQGATAEGFKLEVAARFTFAGEGTFVACPVNGEKIWGGATIPVGTYEIYYQNKGAQKPKECLKGITITLGTSPV